MEFGVGAHLRRLEHNHDEAIAAQPRDDLLFVPAARLNADPLDAMLAQPSRQFGVTVAVLAMSSLRLPVSMPAQIVVCWLIFVDPSL